MDGQLHSDIRNCPFRLLELAHGPRRGPARCGGGSYAPIGGHWPAELERQLLSVAFDYGQEPSELLRVETSRIAGRRRSPIGRDTGAETLLVLFMHFLDLVRARGNANEVKLRSGERWRLASEAPLITETWIVDGVHERALVIEGGGAFAATIELPDVTVRVAGTSDRKALALQTVTDIEQYMRAH